MAYGCKKAVANDFSLDDKVWGCSLEFWVAQGGSLDCGRLYMLLCKLVAVDIVMFSNSEMMLRISILMTFNVEVLERDIVTLSRNGPLEIW